MWDEVQELKALLDHYDDMYYNHDNPEIEDAEYDLLKARYLELIGAEEYEKVPGVAKFNQVEHWSPIKSLAKVKDVNTLHNEIARLWPVVVQPKFDGITLVMYPRMSSEAGPAQVGRIVTRGDGMIGEDVTENAKYIDGIGRFGVLFQPAIRGEAVITKSAFNELNRNRDVPFKNPRNAVAGILRNKDASNVKGITFFAYNFVHRGDITDEADPANASQSLQIDVMKNEFKWNVSPTWSFNTIEETVNFILNFDRHSLDYEIDGLVIKSDKPNSRAIYGETGHHPKDAIAWKFPIEGKWTKLKNVIWQVGRTGRVTPVAEFEPVELMGSTVTRATLHNTGYMRALNLCERSEVKVVKANEIIPAVVDARYTESKTTRMIEEICKCPECNSTLVKVNEQLFCQNPTCPAQLAGRIELLGKRDALDIEGLSEETATKFVDAGLKSPFDIFDWTIEDIMKLPGFAKKSAENLYNAIQSRRSVEFHRFLYAAGIPGVGKSTSMDIAKTFGTWETFAEDIRNGLKRTREINGIGDTLLANIIMHHTLWLRLLEKVKPQSQKVATPEQVLTFVITGSFDKPKSYYENLIRAAGHNISGSVSKKTSYVLVGKDAGSKKDKAEKLGIPMITSEEDLLNLIQ